MSLGRGRLARRICRRARPHYVIRETARAGRPEPWCQRRRHDVPDTCHPARRRSIAGSRHCADGIAGTRAAVASRRRSIRSRERTTGDSIMKKLIFALAGASLLVTAGVALASHSADLALDANRMFFRYWAPGVDSGDFQVLSGNVHNPIVLPCDVTSFGGQLDIDYLGTGPTVVPQLTATFFDDQNQPITSHGCLGDTNLTSEGGTFNPIAAGGVQTDGYILVSSTNQFCQWL